MELMAAVIVAVATALIGGLVLDRIRAVPKRAEGQMTRALQGIPEDRDRKRWAEELRQVLSEFEGRPYKQFREGRELIRAAERLVAVYAPKPAEIAAVGASEASEPEIESGWEPDLRDALSSLSHETLREMLENLSYRERRVLELRLGLGGEERRSFQGIARTFNITTERAREIERLSLMKLASLGEAQRLRDE